MTKQEFDRADYRRGFHLVALDIEGDWNRPLLENAAAISCADCVFATSGLGEWSDPSTPLEEVLAEFRHVVACETVRSSVSVYDFPAPRGKTALIVGNEEKGIPRAILKKAGSIISIPMIGAGMSSVNVAVSAAIALYVCSKDMGRRKRMKRERSHRDVDVLIHAPGDPHELGSLLRSAWAFGWRRVYVSDRHGSWFTRDRQMALDSRAAARRHKNPLAVLEADKLDAADFDVVLSCNEGRDGSPLSRLQLPNAHRALLVLGSPDDSGAGFTESDETFHVDFDNPRVGVRFRHSGSIVLSVVSEMLRG